MSDIDCDLWFAQSRAEAMASYQNNDLKFIELTHLSKALTCYSLASLVAKASGIAPLTVEICMKRYDDGTNERVALIEFKCPADALRSLEKIKSSAFGRKWQLKLMSDPKKETDRVIPHSWTN